MLDLVRIEQQTGMHITDSGLNVGGYFYKGLERAIELIFRC